MDQNDQAEIEQLFGQINALFSRKEYEEADQLLSAILERQPDHPRALHARGVMACERGAYAEARDLVRRALQGEPEKAAFLNSMGNICRSSGDLQQAREWFGKALHADPGLALAHHNLALLELQSGALEEAIEEFREALALQPDHFPSVFYLGVTHIKLTQFQEAAAQLNRAIELAPSDYRAYVGVAEAYKSLNQSAAAEEICRKGLAATSGHPELFQQLGLVLLRQGRVDEATACQRRAMEGDPCHADSYSNLTFALNYDPCATQDQIFASAVRWAELGCAGVSPRTLFDNLPDPERPLRIGYVSGDLCGHPVGYHLLPVLRNHDRSRFRIYCYSNSPTGDKLTMEFQELCDQWRMIPHLDDDQACERIRGDQIDILVDLSGHTAHDRLKVFARKPAPVQATWLGYFNTTGLSAIDYLITDDATVLPGEEQLFSEQVLRLPWSRFCFSPYPSLPDVAPPPSLARGYVTFGSFNTLAKVNPAVVALWSRVLGELPGSRLIMKRGEFRDPSLRQRFCDLFEEHGIEPARLELRGPSSYYDMLAEYGDVDIALDSFPFNGGATTLDALVMGVPVVTLSGKLPISRQSRAFLRALNLLELVARNADRYCAIACELARDAERLQRLRGELRGRLLNSYLCDGREFTKNLEHAYRTMWQNWCRQGREASGGSRG